MAKDDRNRKNAKFLNQDGYLNRQGASSADKERSSANTEFADECCCGEKKNRGNADNEKDSVIRNQRTEFAREIDAGRRHILDIENAGVNHGRNQSGILDDTEFGRDYESGRRDTAPAAGMNFDSRKHNQQSKDSSSKSTAERTKTDASVTKRLHEQQGVGPKTTGYKDNHLHNN